MSFEQVFDQLEKVVAELEQEDLPLERAVELYELGMQLVRFANERLANAELRIRQLSEGTAEEVAVVQESFTQTS